MLAKLNFNSHYCSVPCHMMHQKSFHYDDLVRHFWSTENINFIYFINSILEKTKNKTYWIQNFEGVCICKCNKESIAIVHELKGLCVLVSTASMSIGCFQPVICWIWIIGLILQGSTQRLRQTRVSVIHTVKYWL